MIEVSDTGIGIPAEQYPHLFSRFFRASNATEAGIKGTGLGLAVTKAIVEAHGGTIAAGPAAGRRHHVRRPAAGQRARRPDRSRHRGQGVTHLLVEMDPAVGPAGLVEELPGGALDSVVLGRPGPRPTSLADRGSG